VIVKIQRYLTKNIHVGYLMAAKNVPHLELKYNHFLFLNAGSPLVLEGGNSTSYAA